MTTTLTATHNPGDSQGGAPHVALDLYTDVYVQSIARTDANGTLGILGGNFIPEEPLKRRNYIPNPSVEVDLTGWSSANNITHSRTTLSSTPDGSYALEVLIGAAPGSSEFVAIDADTSIIEEGAWVGFGVSCRAGTGSRYYHQRILFYDAAGSLLEIADGKILWLADTFRRDTFAAQIPAGTARVWCLTYLTHSTTDRSPNGGSIYYTDAWMASRGTTEAEALDLVELYFDGDTPPRQDPEDPGDPDSLEHRWTGVAHNSISEEYDPNPTRTKLLNDVSAAAGTVTYQVRGEGFTLLAEATVEHPLESPWLVMPYMVGTPRGRAVDRVTAYAATRPSQSVVHPIIGREAPVVSMGPLGLAQGTMELYAGTFEQLRTLEGLLAEGQVLALRQTLQDFDVYFVPMSTIRSSYEVLGQDATIWRLTVEFAEVAPPEVLL